MKRTFWALLLMGAVPISAAAQKAVTQGEIVEVTAEISYQVDPLTCTRYGAPMKVLAFITEASVIKRVLDQTNYRRDTTMKTTRTQILTPAALAFACGGRGET